MFRQKILSMVILAGMLLGQAVPLAQAATYCDQAQFVSDITVPDGAAFTPAASFTKTWRFMNAGTCTWTTSYTLVYAGGDAMGSTASVNLPVNVAPGQMLDVSVNLTAPAAPGHYKSLWKFANASGGQFGIGDSASDAFWVDINVVDTNAVIYDFVANAPYAQWKSGAGTLPFPGTSGDSRGFAYQVDRPHLEDDSYDSQPGLLVVPQNKYNGYIQATYPEFQVQQGDRLPGGHGNAVLVALGEVIQGREQFALPGICHQIAEFVGIIRQVLHDLLFGAGFFDVLGGKPDG